MSIKIDKVLGCEYHRNGICGIGFYVVDFIIWSNENVRAILFSNGDEKPTHYAIVSEDISHKWRGDHFIDVIWDFIKEREA